MFEGFYECLWLTRIACAVSILKRCLYITFKGKSPVVRDPISWNAEPITFMFPCQSILLFRLIRYHLKILYPVTFFHYFLHKRVTVKNIPVYILIYFVTYCQTSFDAFAFTNVVNVFIDICVFDFTRLWWVYMHIM